MSTLDGINPFTDFLRWQMWGGLLDSSVEAVAYIFLGGNLSSIIDRYAPDSLEWLKKKIMWDGGESWWSRTLFDTATVLIMCMVLMYVIMTLRFSVESIPSPFTQQTGASVGSFFAVWVVMSNSAFFKSKVLGLITI